MWKLKTLWIIKQKTITKIDNYAKTKAFKELSKDKQEAILYLKEIKPAPMPEGMPRDDLDNLFKHFNGKQDQQQREIYTKLLDDTRVNADIKIETQREGQLRQAYIKAYQHEITHDLYYMYVTQDNDRIHITSFPMTKLKDVISQIKKCVRVVS